MSMPTNISMILVPISTSSSNNFIPNVIPQYQNRSVSPSSVDSHGVLTRKLKDQFCAFEKKLKCQQYLVIKAVTFVHTQLKLCWLKQIQATAKTTKTYGNPNTVTTQITLINKIVEQSLGIHLQHINTKYNQYYQQLSSNYSILHFQMCNNVLKLGKTKKNCQFGVCSSFYYAPNQMGPSQQITVRKTETRPFVKNEHMFATTLPPPIITQQTPLARMEPVRPVGPVGTVGTVWDCNLKQTQHGPTLLCLDNASPDSSNTTTSSVTGVAGVATPPTSISSESTVTIVVPSAFPSVNSCYENTSNMADNIADIKLEVGAPDRGLISNTDVSRSPATASIEYSGNVNTCAQATVSRSRKSVWYKQAGLYCKKLGIWCCNLCDKKLKSQSGIITHLQSQHKQKIHNLIEKNQSIRVGPTVFTKSARLMFENYIQTEDLNYKCKICNKIIYTRTGTISHTKSHLGIKNFQCRFCDKKFGGKTARDRHELRHQGIKPFECDICHKRFTLKQGLVTHQVTHTKEKNHQCKVCGKKYTQSSSLKRHQKQQRHEQQQT